MLVYPAHAGLDMSTFGKRYAFVDGNEVFGVKTVVM